LMTLIFMSGVPSREGWLVPGRLIRDWAGCLKT